MKLSIRMKLFFSFLPMIGLPLIIVGSLFFVGIRTQALDFYASSSEKELRQVDSSLTQFFHTAEEDLNYLASTPQLRALDRSITSYTRIRKVTPMDISKGTVVEKEIYEVFKQFTRAKESYDYLTIGTEAGGFIYYPPKARKPKIVNGKWVEGYVPAKRSWYRSARSAYLQSGSQGTFTLPYSAYASNSAEILLSPGSYFKSDIGLGYVLSFDINLTGFTDKIDEIVIGDGGHVVMVEHRKQSDGSQLNVILADPMLEKVQALIPEYFAAKKEREIRENGGKPMFHFLEEVYEGQLQRALESDTSFNRVILAGQEFLSFHYPSSMENYSYFALIPASELDKTVRPIVLIITFTILIFIFLMLLISLVLSNGLAKPVRRLDRILKGLSEGEGDLTTAVPVTTRDEIGEASVSLNSFIGKLKSIVVNIKDNLKRNSAMRRRLGELTANVVESTRDIASTIKEVEYNAGGMDNQAVESASSIEQITRGLENLDQLIQQQATAVQETSASVAEMASSLSSMAGVTRTKKESVSQIETVSYEGGLKLQESVSKIKGINNRIDDIIELTELINSISAQTNLLAMNAAIEAAHAGDAGKGFAVVAEEIRKLAESAADSSKAISVRIEDIVVEITAAAESGDSTLSAFNEIRHSIQDMINSFDEIYMTTQEISSGSEHITEATELLNQISSEVRDGSGEMRMGLSEMEKAMSDLKNISAAVHEQTARITRRTDSVLSEIHSLKSIESSLSDSTGELEQQVARFKTE